MDKVRTICATCCRVMSVLPIRAAHNTPVCHGKEMLIAGPVKIDRTGVSGMRGAPVDPVARYRAAHGIKSPPPALPAMIGVEAMFLRVICKLRDSKFAETVNEALYEAEAETDSGNHDMVATEFLRRLEKAGKH